MRQIIPETYFSFSEHTQLFLYSCIAGILFGIIYDIFRTFRIIVPHNNILVIIEDIAFFVIYTVFLISFISVFARGEFRIFYILGNFLGFILYFFTVGKIIIEIIKKFILVIKHVLAFIFKPFYFLYVVMSKKIGRKFVGFYKNFSKQLKILFLHLIDRYKMLYNNKVIHKRKNVKKYDKKEKKTKVRKKNK